MKKPRIFCFEKNDPFEKEQIRSFLDKLYLFKGSRRTKEQTVLLERTKERRKNKSFFSIEWKNHERMGLLFFEEQKNKLSFFEDQKNNKRATTQNKFILFCLWGRGVAWLGGWWAVGWTNCSFLNDERTICSFFWSNCSFQGLKEWTPFFLKERKNDKWTESIFLKEQRIDKSSDYDTALLTGGIALLRKFVPGNAQWHCSAALLSGTAQWQCSSPMHINL